MWAIAIYSPGFCRKTYTSTKISPVVWSCAFPKIIRIEALSFGIFHRGIQSFWDNPFFHKKSLSIFEREDVQWWKEIFKSNNILFTFKIVHKPTFTNMLKMTRSINYLSNIGFQWFPNSLIPFFKESNMIFCFLVFFFLWFFFFLHCFWLLFLFFKFFFCQYINQLEDWQPWCETNMKGVIFFP